MMVVVVVDAETAFVDAETASVMAFIYDKSPLSNLLCCVADFLSYA